MGEANASAAGKNEAAGAKESSGAKESVEKKEAAEKKERKKYGWVLVSIPDFPPQDPGRWLVYRVYPTGLKAERKAKRLMRRFPEYAWRGEALTLAQATAIKRKPIRVMGLGAEVEVQFTASGFKVVVVDKKTRAPKS